MHILVIDDSAADRRLCRLLLGDAIREEGIENKVEIREARNAQEGLESCRTNVPTCILLDYKLPDMSGLDFLSLVSDGRSLSPPPAVVMLTGLGNEKVAAEAMKAGAQDYLVKDQLTGHGLLLAVRKASEKVHLVTTLASERDRLQASLAEKDILLREVHHRVKNNLQVIGSLLKLHADSLRDEVAVVALREAQHRVESMSLIHEQLYRSDNAHAVEVRDHIRDLSWNLARAYAASEHGIACRLQIEPFVLELDRAIPLSLILNELISNALKHAFPAGRKGTISISAVRKTDCVDVKVQDDGIGMQNSEPQEPKSIGLHIVRILAKQLKGSFRISTSDNRTSCELRFPLLSASRETGMSLQAGGFQ